MSSGILLVVMGGLFLLLGYMGVPVAFAIIAGVLVATAFTPISFQSMIGQLFHGIDSETLLAIPFFLLAGDMMTAANITERLIRFAQVLVGHFRSGLWGGASSSSLYLHAAAFVGPCAAPLGEALGGCRRRSHGPALRLCAGR